MPSEVIPPTGSNEPPEPQGTPIYKLRELISLGTAREIMERKERDFPGIKILLHITEEEVQAMAGQSTPGQNEDPKVQKALSRELLAFSREHPHGIDLELNVSLLPGKHSTNSTLTPGSNVHGGYPLDERDWGDLEQRRLKLQELSKLPFPAVIDSEKYPFIIEVKYSMETFNAAGLSNATDWFDWPRINKNRVLTRSRVAN